MKYSILLIVFTVGCSANNILMINSDEYEFDEIHIFVFAPEVEIFNINKFESPLALRNQNSFSIHSKESYFVNSYLSKLKINKLKKCNQNQSFGYPHMLIDAIKGDDIYSLVSDKKLIYTVDNKLCTPISKQIFDDLNFLSGNSTTKD